MAIKKATYRFLFSGGGTGGHLYPAVAVAEELLKQLPEAELLFVGTSDRIESRVIPAMGYNYKSIPVAGFARNKGIKNILFPFKLLAGMIKSLFIAAKFKPLVAVGAGAYVTGPILWASSVMGAKIVLLEQNSYPGVTNKILEKRASVIHAAFEDARKYFRFQDKIKITGNPVRSSLKLISKDEAVEKLGLDKSKKTVLIVGGSLGAGSINETIAENIDKLDGDIQVIWQTGSYYFEKYKSLNSNSVKVMAFIDDMAAVYSAADVLIARAGATTIAEVSLLGLPVIFVPSPNVAENHQFKNAESLVKENAALLVEDKNIKSELIPALTGLINDDNKLDELRENIKKFARPDAARDIVKDMLGRAGIIDRV